MSWKSIAEETPGLITKVEAYKVSTPPKPTTPSSRRPFLRVKRDADLSQQPAEAQRRLKLLDAHIGSFRTVTLDAALRGGFIKTDENGSYLKDAADEYVFELWPDNTWDVYGMRNVGHITSQFLVKLDELGQVSDLKELVKVARVAVTKLKDTGNGFRQFPNYREAHERALDQLLITGWLAALDNALWVNRNEPEVPSDVQQAMSLMMNEDIMKGLFYRAIDGYYGDGKRAERLALWKKLGANKRYDGSSKADKAGVLNFRAVLDAFQKAGLYLPYDRYGHPLFHPTMSLHCCAQIRRGQYGWAEDAEVAERVGKDLKECRILVDTPKGKVDQHPHFVPGRVKWLNIHYQNITPELALNKYGFVDITYPRESSLTEDLAARAGSSYCTPELAGAFARTVAWVILFDGPESKNVSNTSGGYSADRSLRGKNVFIMRGGQVIKDAPFVLPDASIKEAVSQMSRGNNAMGVRFADAATRKEIERLNDSKWAMGQGHALALALCHTVRV